MDDFVERQNILHFTDMLKAETDPGKREMLLKLLAEEAVKQRTPRSNDAIEKAATSAGPLRAWSLPR
jgi:hypothetical protein